MFRHPENSLEARAKAKARQMLGLTPGLDVITMASQLSVTLDSGQTYEADEYGINDLLSNLQLSSEPYIGRIRECAYYDGSFARDGICVEKSKQVIFMPDRVSRALSDDAYAGYAYSACFRGLSDMSAIVDLPDSEQLKCPLGSALSELFQVIRASATSSNPALGLNILGSRGVLPEYTHSIYDVDQSVGGHCVDAMLLKEDRFFAEWHAKAPPFTIGCNAHHCNYVAS